MDIKGTSAGDLTGLNLIIQIVKKVYEREPHQLEKGALYLVPTPIGNLEDFTLRGLRILSTVDWIAAEDTRHTGLMLHRLGIKKRLISTHQHNEASRSTLLCDLLSNGSVGALVTDAGTPGISDPGQRIVKDLISNEIPAIALPGACALTTALSASGFCHQEFFFTGFLPVKSGQRLRKMQELSGIKASLVFYESPHKMPRFLNEMKHIFPEKDVVIGRELTKKFEQIIRGKGKKVAEDFTEKKWKGELVVVINNE